VIEHYWYNILDNKYVYLNWLPEDEWDGGYHKLPQNHFDIFIYDTMYMNYYISQGWLSALDRDEITYAHEINSNILSSVECDNKKYYGIPIYGCVYVIFYRSDDKE
jgi:thiamine pyridinylase